MKLVMAIMGRDDASVVMEALTEKSIQVTRMASTGGFLQSGNTTLLIGVEDNKTNKVIGIISRYSSKRKQLVTNTAPFFPGTLGQTPFEVTTGGAIIFVLNVEIFEKL